MGSREATLSEQSEMAVADKVKTYVNDVVMPLVNDAQVGVQYIEHSQGKEAAAQYASALVDFAAFLRAAPEIFIGTVTESRPAEFGIDAEARRSIARVKASLKSLGPTYAQRWDAVEEALQTQTLGKAIM